MAFKWFNKVDDGKDGNDNIFGRRLVRPNAATSGCSYKMITVPTLMWTMGKLWKSEAKLCTIDRHLENVNKGSYNYACNFISYYKEKFSAGSL